MRQSQGLQEVMEICRARDGTTTLTRLSRQTSPAASHLNGCSIFPFAHLQSLQGRHYCVVVANHATERPLVEVLPVFALEEAAARVTKAPLRPLRRRAPCHVSDGHGVRRRWVRVVSAAVELKASDDVIRVGPHKRGS